MRYSRFAALALGVAWVPLTGAQNLTSTGCVDPTGFQTCYDKATANGFVCTSACNGQDICVLACGCAMYEVQIGCLMQSCWNKAYTCEYQIFAVNMASNCPINTTQIPYWPAPANAPNSCSCNLENVYDAVLQSINAQTACNNRVSSTLSLTDPLQAVRNTTGCQCCAASGAISAGYDLCPDTPPSQFGLDHVISLVNVASGGKGFGTCDSTLSLFNCVSDLSFPALPGAGKYYANSKLPANGTKSLSNSGGSVTAPPQGSTTVIAFTSAAYTITAASYNTANVGTTAAVTATTGGTATTGSSATGTQSAAATTSSKSAATDRKPSWAVLPFAIVAVCILA